MATAHTIGDYARSPRTKAEITYHLPDDPTHAGTITVTMPEPEVARLAHFDPRPITTFAPASRATLTALRDTIDRALVAPRVVQRCDGVFGGHGVALALSWTGEQ